MWRLGGAGRLARMMRLGEARLGQDVEVRRLGGAELGCGGWVGLD